MLCVFPFVRLYLVLFRLALSRQFLTVLKQIGHSTRYHVPGVWFFFTRTFHSHSLAECTSPYSMIPYLDFSGQFVASIAKRGFLFLCLSVDLVQFQLYVRFFFFPQRP